MAESDAAPATTPEAVPATTTPEGEASAPVATPPEEEKAPPADAAPTDAAAKTEEGGVAAGTEAGSKKTEGGAAKPQRGIRVHVKNLGANATTDQLKELFKPYGEVMLAEAKTDSDGKCKGFGFVVLPNMEGAKKAVEEMHDKEVEGKKLVVEIVEQRAKGESKGKTKGEVKGKGGVDSKGKGKGKEKGKAQGKERAPPTINTAVAQQTYADQYGGYPGMASPYGYGGYPMSPSAYPGFPMQAQMQAMQLAQYQYAQQMMQMHQMQQMQAMGMSGLWSPHARAMPTGLWPPAAQGVPGVPGGAASPMAIPPAKAPAPAAPAAAAKEEADFFPSGGKDKGKVKGKGKGKGKTDKRSEEKAGEAKADVPPPPADKVFVGSLKSLSEKNGYGFIVCAEVKSSYQRDTWVDSGLLPENVKVGDNLKFKIALSGKGHPQAQEVSAA